MAGANWIRDPVAVEEFEAEAVEHDLPFERESLNSGTGLRYRVPIGVAGYLDERELTIDLLPARPRPPSPRVFIDGPPCLKHRWPDDALCMWLESDPPSRRWTRADGLAQLVGFAAEHAFCEAQCRDGLPWPKIEAPGFHPRPRDCPSCPRPAPASR